MFLFCYALRGLCVHLSFSIILKRKRKLIALLLLSYRCIVTINVLRLFLTVPWVGLKYANMIFSDHTHLHFERDAWIRLLEQIKRKNTTFTKQEGQSSIILCLLVKKWFVDTLSSQRAKCIKGLIWPPLEPKSESCFSSISSDWFMRRITQV